MAGRYCRDCESWCELSDFSRNQWAKGDGRSRCYECVSDSQQTVYCDHGCGAFSSDNALAMHMQTHQDSICHDCGRNFGNHKTSANQLRMHAQTHAERNVACPICGDRRFKSSANAVAHVESGYCSGCRGADNASRQIYGYMQQTAPHLIGNGQMMLEYGGGSMPANPYTCQYCDRSFKQLSAMMQHSQMKHNSGLALRW